MPQYIYFFAYFNISTFYFSSVFFSADASIYLSIYPSIHPSIYPGILQSMHRIYIFQLSRYHHFYNHSIIIISAVTVVMHQNSFFQVVHPSAVFPL
jgi:hypothetical protein